MASVLIDNNLSVILKTVFEKEFPGSMHVYELGLEKASDTEIWEIAKGKYDAIISKDKDFYFRIMLHGSPPKLIWIARGNCRNREILDLIRENTSKIKAFLASNQEVLKLT